VDGARVVSSVFRIPFGGSSILIADEPIQDPLAHTRNCFFAGPENSLLPTLITQTVRPFSEASVFTPFVLWGGGGTGKSLLTKGLVERCRSDGQEVIFIDGKSVGYHALKKQVRISPPGALWVVDDLDLLTPTDSTVEVLCHLLDRAVGEKWRMVFTASCPPNALPHFPARLRSRLIGGLVLQLNRLSVTSKSTILHELGRHSEMHLDQGAVDLLTKYVQDTDEDLEELVARVYTSKHTENARCIDSVIMRKLLNNRRTQRRPSLVEICRVTSKYFGITIRELKGRSRQQGIVFPRHVFMYIAHQLFDHRVQKIGLFLCRDHSTVLHGCHVIRKKITLEPDVEKHVSLLKTTIHKQR